LSQIPPSGPFLPVVPVYNHCTVNNLRFRSQHGMEEVIGSIPIRSTNFSPAIPPYSGFDSALYRNVDAKGYFPQENATSHDLQMAALESKPL
jgi:hypothetical protein